MKKGLESYQKVVGPVPSAPAWGNQEIGHLSPPGKCGVITQHSGGKRSLMAVVNRVNVAVESHTNEALHGHMRVSTVTGKKRKMNLGMNKQ